MFNPATSPFTSEPVYPFFVARQGLANAPIITPLAPAPVMAPATTTESAVAIQACQLLAMAELEARHLMHRPW